MSSEQVNDLVREHYESESLGQNKLSELKNMIVNAENASEPERLKSRRFPMLSLISSIAALLVLTFSLSIWIYSKNNHQSQRADHILAQIAMNHRKGLAPDYSNPDFQALCDSMDKLDFQMIKSQHLKDRNLTIVGARYCSVGPLIAAQIRLVDDQNRRYTLYQSRDDQYLQVVKNSKQVRDGMTMEVWRESGVWMAMAGPSSTP